MTEQAPQSEAGSDRFFDALEDVHAARAAKEMVDAGAESSIQSKLPEAGQRSVERERRIREAEQSRWDEAMEIELKNAPTNARARQRVEAKGIKRPTEPEDPAAMQMARDAEARANAPKKEPGQPRKTVGARENAALSPGIRRLPGYDKRPEK